MNGEKSKKKEFQGKAIWKAIIRENLIQEGQIYIDNKETRKELNIPN